MEAFTQVHLFEDELVALGLKYTGIDASDDGKQLILRTCHFDSNFALLDISEDDRLHALVLLMDKESEPFRQHETRNLSRSLKSHLARNKPAESLFHVSCIQIRYIQSNSGVERIAFDCDVDVDASEELVVAQDTRSPFCIEEIRGGNLLQIHF